MTGWSTTRPTPISRPTSAPFSLSARASPEKRPRDASNPPASMTPLTCTNAVTRGFTRCPAREKSSRSTAASSSSTRISSGFDESSTFTGFDFKSSAMMNWPSGLRAKMREGCFSFTVIATGLRRVRFTDADGTERMGLPPWMRVSEGRVPTRMSAMSRASPCGGSVPVRMTRSSVSPESRSFPTETGRFIARVSSADTMGAARSRCRFARWTRLVPTHSAKMHGGSTIIRKASKR